MRSVYKAENAFDAQLLRDRLEQAGIAATVHGLLLTGAVGELPVDARPSVWIVDDAQYERARQLVAEFEQPPPQRPTWTCPACHEPNGPAFETCWHCGSSPHPTERTSDGHG